MNNTSEKAKEFCAQVKLSDFNCIQAHGGLLVLDEKYHIIQYSENITTLFEVPAQQLITQPITAFLRFENTEQDLILWLKQADRKCRPLNWGSSEKQFKIWACVYQVPEGLIVEMEPIIEGQAIEADKIFDLTQYVVKGLRTRVANQSIEQIMQTACEEIQMATGFDRVLVYQFNQEDQSAVVVAEAVPGGIDSYIGMHFAANNIPKNMRAMYLKLLVRYMPNIHEKSYKIIPENNPITRNPLDLSACNSHVISPALKKHLVNMNIASSTSIAIVCEGRLWGIILCHNKKPKYLSVNLRHVLLLVADAMANQILISERRKARAKEEKVAEIQASLTKNINNTDSLNNILNQYHPHFMELVSATGMSICCKNKVINYGDTPTEEQLRVLILWLKKAKLPYASPSLPLQFPAAMAYKDKACGLLVIKLTELENHCLLFYRPEFIRSIYWAGDPSDEMCWNTEDYSPRDPYNRFTQTLFNQATPWNSYDMRSAHVVRSIIVSRQLQDLLQAQETWDSFLKSSQG